MQFYYAFISRTKCDCSCLKIALDRTVYRHHCLLGASVVWFVPKTDTQAARGLFSGKLRHHVYTRVRRVQPTEAGSTALGGHRGDSLCHTFRPTSTRVAEEYSVGMLGRVCCSKAH